MHKNNECSICIDIILCVSNMVLKMPCEIYQSTYENWKMQNKIKQIIIKKRYIIFKFKDTFNLQTHRFFTASDFIMITIIFST